jgi:hypothetical protein
MKSLCLLLASALSLPALAADPPPIPVHFQPMSFLVGHCWEGDIPNKGRDEHCFEWVFGNKFIRDRHTVKGNHNKAGETLYAFDAKKQIVVYNYWSSDGGMSNGTMTPQADRLLFPEDTYEQDGKKIIFRSTWQRMGDTRYAAIVHMKSGEEWKEAWRVVYTKK